MSSQPQSKEFAERRKVITKSASDRLWAVFMLSVVVLLIIGSIIVASGKYYEPGDAVGYNIGLLGGVMLLSLLLYPLRKRVNLFRSVGLLPGWFKWHMVLGILAPVMIVFHATFHIESINAGVAMVCMLLVSGSGTFGRFFYTKIHHGLYGRQTTVNEMKAELERSGEVKSTFSFAPEIEKKLNEFRELAEKNTAAGKLGLVRFVLVGMKAAKLSRSLANELHGIMHKQAREKNFTPDQMRSMDTLYTEYERLISSYLTAVKDASQFHTYERLFSYWHIFHIPLVYMMVFSGFYHVYAVHAY